MFIGIEPYIPHVETTFVMLSYCGECGFLDGLAIILFHSVTFCSRLCLHVLILWPSLGLVGSYRWNLV
jgi:hypothetical protein